VRAVAGRDGGRRRVEEGVADPPHRGGKGWFVWLVAGLGLAVRSGLGELSAGVGRGVFRFFCWGLSLGSSSQRGESCSLLVFS